MWSQSTRLVREGALGPLSFAMKDSIQSNQRTFKQNSYWLIGVSYNIDEILELLKRIAGLMPLFF